MKVERSAFLLVLVATALLSFKGIFTKFAYANGVSIDALLILRFVGAVPMFWMVFFLAQWTQKSASAIPEPYAHWYTEWAWCALAGFVFFLGARFDFTSLAYLPAGISRLILFTFPALVLLFNSILARSWPQRKHLLAFAVTYFGLLILLLPMSSGASLYSTGVAFAFGSSFLYALFLVINQRVLQRMPTLKYTVMTNTFTLVWFALEASVFAPQWEWGQVISTTIFWVSIIVVFTTVAPFFMLNEGVRRLGSSEASLIALTGPLITVVAAWALLDEAMTLGQVGASAIILMGIAVLQGVTMRGLARRFGL